MKPKKRICLREACGRPVIALSANSGYCSEKCKKMHTSKITAAMNRWLKELRLVPSWGDQ